MRNVGLSVCRNNDSPDLVAASEKAGQPHHCSNPAGCPRERFRSGHMAGYACFAADVLYLAGLSATG